MDTYIVSWILLSVILLSLGTSCTSASKCSGQWAIHACAGGNGKRSGTSANLGENNNGGEANGSRKTGLALIDRLLENQQSYDPYRGGDNRGSDLDDSRFYDDRSLDLDDSSLVDSSSSNSDDLIGLQRGGSRSLLRGGSSADRYEGLRRAEMAEGRYRQYLRRLVALMLANDKEA